MSGIFITVLNMSLTASYVALAVIVVRLLLRKSPKIFSYILWGVVLFRLLLLFSIPSHLSFIPGETNYIPQDIVYSENPAINTGIEIVDNPVNKTIQSSFSPNPAESVNPMGVLIEVGTIIWLLGIAILLLYSAISYLKFKHQLSFAILVRDNIYESDRIQGPFVLGFIKPRIYIPTGLAGKELDYILKHEETHIKRKDYLIKPVALLAATLHWFNPIIWISYFLMIKDMEMSCDESVIKQTSGDIRTCYSKSLLILSAKQSGLLSPLSFGESNIKSRVKNILNYKSPKFWMVIVCILMVVVVATVLLMNESVYLDPADMSEYNGIRGKINRDPRNAYGVTSSPIINKSTTNKGITITILQLFGDSEGVVLIASWESNGKNERIGFPNIKIPSGDGFRSATIASASSRKAGKYSGIFIYDKNSSLKRDTEEILGEEHGDGSSVS